MFLSILKVMRRGTDVTIFKYAYYNEKILATSLMTTPKK